MTGYLLCKERSKEMTTSDTTATRFVETKEPEIPSRETAPQRSLSLTAVLSLAAAAIGLRGIIYFGIHARVEAAAKLKRVTAQAAIPTVHVVSPQDAAPDEELVLPGNTQAFTDAPIFARTNGYLKRWYFDIGAYVKQGRLLAEIETPEADQQLQQARADLKTAQANLATAKITADRWQFLLKTNSVSQQETD